MTLHDACQQIGIKYKTVPMDEQWHATGIANKPKSDAGRIYLFSDGSGGIVWNWMIDESLTYWTEERTDLSPAEKRERNRKYKAALQKAEADREKRYAEAARLAELVYEDADPARADHPYLQRKQVTPTATLREMPVDELAGIIGYHPKAKETPLSGRIIIAPVASDTLTTLEFIDEAGRKSALAGGRKKGAYWQTSTEGETLFVAEGVATALSIHMATGQPCAAVLSCGNFDAAIAVLKAKRPSVPVIVCPDIGNGQEKAIAAAQAHELPVVLPVVTHGTDYNDMHVESGVSAVRDLLHSVMPKQRVQFQSLPEMIAALPETINWQVENFIEAGSTVCFFGASEQGKSFIVADLSMSIATGTSFAGMPTSTGNVLILVGEGRNGFLRRLQSWCSYHGHGLPENVFLSTYNVDIYKPLELPDVKIDFIVCDTLAQHYDGDENDASSMMQFLERMELIQRRYHGSTVCIVHHSGTQSTDRTRGSTALRAALDAEFKVASGVLSCSKMKDFEHPKPLCFRLESEGKSAVIVWGEDNNVQEKLSDLGVIIHDCMIEAVRILRENRVPDEMLRGLVYPHLTCKEENKRHYYKRGLENATGTVVAVQAVQNAVQPIYSLMREQDIEIASFRWLRGTSGT